MSNSSNDNETIQQRRERILQAQAARQRAREEEIARQEAEKAEEEQVVREKKKEQEIAEKKRLEERRIAEEKRRVEEAAAAAEDECVRNAAYAKLVEENRVEREKAAKELEKRQKRPVAKDQPKKSFKSKSIISNDSDVEQREVMPAPRGEKRKRPIKMIARGGPHSDPDEDFEPENPTNSPLPSTDPSQNCPACARCVSIGKPSECRPQSLRRQAQPCIVCHQQRQRCSWSGDNASRRSRGKRGPAARAGERRFEGPGIAEQLAAIVGQNKDLIDIARRSLVLQQRILHLLVRRERREEAREELEKSGDEEEEEEDGEGEEDEEEKEKNNEEKKREEIREGKRRAD
ncbi:hypothetical protein GGU11DRAFT_803989 [Lentinula aff. detonsa]|nr:hypothetical protein GGU11DRAFT_803989 [Lentinula aff. detonsa]